MSAESLVSQIINNAQTTANTARDKAIEYANSAQTAATGSIAPGAAPSIQVPNVLIPPFDPSIDFTGDFNRAYDIAIAEYDPAFQAELARFISTYFPDFIGCLKTSVSGWICSTITNGGTGMNPDVENAIYERSRTREILDARRAEDEAVSGYAARGWMLASGILIDSMQRVQQALSDKVSTHGRDVMIKQAEIEIENVRFAVGEGAKLQFGVMSALTNFIVAWANMRELAIEKAKALLDAKTRLYSSVGAYYSAIIGAAALRLDYDKIRVDSHVALSDIEVKGFTDRLASRVGAAISAAEAMGAIAGSALSAQNTLAEIGNQTINNSSS